MTTYTSAEEIRPRLERPIASLGNFDGVHRGHQFIIERVLSRARESVRPALLVTFRPHPLKIIRPRSAPPLIQTHEEKMALIAAVGVEHALVIPFTASFTASSESRRCTSEVISISAGAGRVTWSFCAASGQS